MAGPEPKVHRSADALAERLRSVRRLTAALAEPLSAEDCQIQSMPDVSPVKWHLAHTTWFFETFVLRPKVSGYEAFHPEFEYLFNSYYNGVGDQFPRSQRGLLSRPALAEVMEYRRRVDSALDDLFASDLRPEVLALLELGLNHEQQHQELILTDIKHVLSCNPSTPVYRARPPHSVGASAVAAKWVQHAGGVVELGARSGFAFDNETPRHEVLVQPFELGSRLITNSEFRQFVTEGGYRNPSLWLSEGWDHVQAQQWQQPMYWDEDCESHFTLAGTQPLASDEPVCHLSYFEADAFARWAGHRLPREQEWEVLAEGATLSGNFLDQGVLQPQRCEGKAGLRQMFGDVWEWTQSPYVSYPGFRPLGGTIGEYNGKFMCNQFVLRGGSCVTAQDHVRPSYRNFFPPTARWQFSGLRLARDA